MDGADLPFDGQEASGGPPLSDHLVLEFEAVAARGGRPLPEGAPVPRCPCEPCRRRRVVEVLHDGAGPELREPPTLGKHREHIGGRTEATAS